VRTSITRFFCLIILTGTVLSLSAADPPGFEHWTASQLKGFENTLAAKIGAQNTATQQLATFGNHAAIMARRGGSGQAEMHMVQADVFVVQSGETTLIVGGEIVDGKQTRPNEVLGSSIRGGMQRKLGPGDVVHIPPKTPHQMLVQPGQQITYLALKFDTF
jgi:mannose-6-phosphate isomerase-like protein (cupin superfamily)